MTLPTDTPGNRGVDATKLATIASGFASNSKAFMVAVNGHVIREDYWNGCASTTRVDGQSIAKSVTATAVGAAILQHHIGSIEEPVTKWFSAYETTANKNEITLRDLLQMTSGINAAPSQYATMIASGDWANYVMSLAMENQPGHRWRYKTDPNVTAKVIALATGQFLGDYLDAEVFTPIGLTDWAWTADSVGHHNGSGDFQTTTEGFMRLGLLWLNKGVWNGSQVIDRQFMLAAVAPTLSPSRMFCNCWGAAGALKTDPLEYGLGFWCRYWPAPASPNVPTRPDVFYAFGGWGHFVICIPSLDMVVVRLAHTSSQWPDGQMLLDLLNALDDAVL